MKDCDAVIVGSGPAGATAAAVLTAAGWSVIVLEKGRNHLLDLEAPFAAAGHVSNDEIKFSRRFFLGPDPLLEPRTYRNRADQGDEVDVGEVNNLPSTVGGGGFHADGKLPRFREDDFKPLSAAGPVDGAALVDWPVDYDEMEPYYAAAEQTVGVAGEAGANPFASWRADPYPMPAGPDMFCAVVTGEAATRMGYHPYRVPTGVNSVEFDGRPACNNCGFCGYYGCPIDAKGDPVAPLRQALRTGHCEIRPESYVTDVLRDGSGRRATGVRYLDHDLAEHSVSAEHVILAAGAFETPRLLLRTGLGNPDVVGRFLQYHFQTFVLGIFPYRLHGHRGRSVTHLMDDPIVPDELALGAARDVGLPFIRGGIVEHGAAGHPVQEAVYSPSGPAHAARDGRLPDAGPHGRVHDAGRGPAPGDEPHRARPAREGRLRHACRPRDLLTARARDRLRRALGAAPRGGHEGRGRAARVLGDVPAHPRVLRRQARLARAGVTPHHGRRAHG